MEKNVSDERAAWGVALTMAGSMVSGGVIALATAGLLRMTGGEMDGWVALEAYLAGSVGFLLSAPLRTYFQIMKVSQGISPKGILIWLLTVLAVDALAIAVGAILVIGAKSFTEGVTASTLRASFICGVLLTFISGGIHWVAYRGKMHNS